VTNGNVFDHTYGIFHAEIRVKIKIKTAEKFKYKNIHACHRSTWLER